MENIYEIMTAKGLISIIYKIFLQIIYIYIYISIENGKFYEQMIHAEHNKNGQQT